MISLEAVGRPSDPVTFEWSTDDTMLYALGVGAGQEDPTAELQLTTENSAGVELVALPTMVIAMVQRFAPKPDYGDVPQTAIVHGEQHLTVHRPLPAAGRATVTTRIAGIHDHGASAVADVDGELRDAADGELIATTRLTAFLRGQGGFGGSRSSFRAVELPDREPDVVTSLRVRPEQALLYRLSGDRNRLHTDPQFAKEGGFDRPILHGLCTLGMAARRLLGELADGDAARMRSLFARFTRPVQLGQDLRLAAWTGMQTQFRVTDAEGWVVLDRGQVEWT